MTDRVFAYGTLKRGGAHHHRVASLVSAVEPGWVPGDLVDLGAYPGWVHGPGRVHGEVFTVDDLSRILATLDDLEEFHGPGDPRNLYDRVRVPVRVAGGVVDAWAYRYLGPVGCARRVPDGRWPVAGRRGG